MSGQRIIDGLQQALAHIRSLNHLRQVRHKKRGTTYDVIGVAEVQISKGALGDGETVFEGDKLTVYVCQETGKIYARFPDEFEDGRFEDLS